MAFPYLTEAGFESGTAGHFDTGTDNDGRLDFAHYTQLARVPGQGSPWRGAYCMRVNLAHDGTPDDAYVQENISWTTAPGATIYIRFMFRVSADLVMADGNSLAMFQLTSGATNQEAGVFLSYTTAGGPELVIGKAGGSTISTPLILGEWHALEMRCVIDSGVADDGTIDSWLDGGALPQVTGLDQAAINSGLLGVRGQDPNTTAGTILYDDVVADDTRIGAAREQFPVQVMLTSSGHVFVGTGTVERVDLLSGSATDNVLSVFDTDRADTGDPSGAILELRNVANNEPVMMQYSTLDVHRGFYVALGGTAPRAIVKIYRASSYSEGAVRNQGLQVVGV